MNSQQLQKEMEVVEGLLGEMPADTRASFVRPRVPTDLDTPFGTATSETEKDRRALKATTEGREAPPR